MELTTQQALDLGLWEDYAGTIDHLVEKCASPAVAIRTAMSDMYVKSAVDVYWNPCEERAELFARHPEGMSAEDARSELSLCKAAVASVVDVRETPLTLAELEDWRVKVAESPTLKSMAEGLNFAPTGPRSFGGRPIASTLATGLLGTGLGAAGGAFMDYLTPDELKSEEGTNFVPVGAALGGLAGAGLGAMPGLINWHQGRNFNDNTLWNKPLGSKFESHLSPDYTNAVYRSLYRPTLKEVRGSFAMGGPAGSMIDIDMLGNVAQLASPQTAAMAMGTAYAASRFPDSRAMPGKITPNQTGLLGMAMGAAGGGLRGYALGTLVGEGLGILTNMPEGTKSKFRSTGAAAGALNAIVPLLFH